MALQTRVLYGGKLPDGRGRWAMTENTFTGVYSTNGYVIANPDNPNSVDATTEFPGFDRLHGWMPPTNLGGYYLEVRRTSGGFTRVKVMTAGGAATPMAEVADNAAHPIPSFRMFIYGR